MRGANEMVARQLDADVYAFRKQFVYPSWKSPGSVPVSVMSVMFIGNTE